MNEDKERKRRLFEHPEELLITNVSFLAVYIFLILFLRFKVGLNFDKFQVSCILLLCTCIVCKYPIRILTGDFSLNIKKGDQFPRVQFQFV